MAIHCAHGDTVLYPLAEITIEVDDHKMQVKAAVSSTLPMAVLLGTDSPELSDLLNGHTLSQRPVDKALVATRAMRKRQKLPRK